MSEHTWHVIGATSSSKIHKKGFVPTSSSGIIQSMKVQKTKILIIDDVIENIQVLGAVLRDAGYSIIIGRSGDDAVRLSLTTDPDLILLDIMMPGMNGHEACRLILADPETKHIPIIFLTALADAENEMKGLALGAVDYITKPFNSELVLSRVSRHIELSKQRTTTPLSHTDRVLSVAAEGESNAVEFKSSIRWNIRADRSDKDIELAWAKTIVAFMNSSGGTLLLGVDDDGQILGLSSDRFKSTDKMLLHVNNVINAHIGAEHSQSIGIQVVSLDEKEVIIIECSASEMPSFLKTQDGDDMYIRLGPSSKKLTTREAVEYLKKKKD